MIGTIIGIGLFQPGMVLLSDGLKAAAGGALRGVLGRFTGGTVRAVASGAAVTALVQSSSATVVTTIGFVSAGLLTLRQAIGIIFGSNIGTTTTGWLVSLLGLKLSIGALALPLVGLGAGTGARSHQFGAQGGGGLTRLLAKERIAWIGLAVAGFGLIFVGIDALQQGISALSERFDPAMLPGGTLSGTLLLILLGIAMTIVLQSSSAAVATTLTALHAGTIGLEQAAALVVGQNIGTTVTAALATIGASVLAKRTALARTSRPVRSRAVKSPAPSVRSDDWPRARRSGVVGRNAAAPRADRPRGQDGTTRAANPPCVMPSSGQGRCGKARVCDRRKACRNRSQRERRGWATSTGRSGRR